MVGSLVMRLVEEEEGEEEEEESSGGRGLGRKTKDGEKTHEEWSGECAHGRGFRRGESAKNKENARERCPLLSFKKKNRLITQGQSVITSTLLTKCVCVCVCVCVDQVSRPSHQHLLLWAGFVTIIILAVAAI